MNKPHGYWTKERCRKAVLKCTNVTQFRKLYAGAFCAIEKYGWYNEFTKHFIPLHKPKGYWTKETIIKEALKYKSKSDFFYNCRSGYSTAWKLGIIDKVCKHMIPVGNLYKRAIYIITFKPKEVYIGLSLDINRRFNQHLMKGPIHDFALTSKYKPTLKALTKYIDIQRAQYLEQYYINKYTKEGYLLLNSVKAGGVGSAGAIKWSYEQVLKEASKYKTRIDFYRNSNVAHSTASQRGWLDEVCKHMIASRKAPKPIISIKDGEELKHISIKAAARTLNLHSAAVSRVLRGKNIQTGGYTFKYIK